MKKLIATPPTHLHGMADECVARHLEEYTPDTGVVIPDPFLGSFWHSTVKSENSEPYKVRRRNEAFHIIIFIVCAQCC